MNLDNLTIFWGLNIVQFILITISTIIIFLIVLKFLKEKLIEKNFPEKEEKEINHEN